ncbi:hypothetical protein Tsubulata_035711 [Turnera subulata]|uniref:F-box domain-containing protein n=1 Tax=Turnera subulata TaxID=218843 RepID=A0A9Q0J3V8_9ROSI|nr:hypothetical protein Tsubulata_035711 [Turnera subulata]
MAPVESVDDDDRWSELPEDILEKIVSSLDVKSMVRVSSLTKSSRRLKKLWPPFYPSIAFDCDLYSHTDCSSFYSKLRHYTKLNKLELYNCSYRDRSGNVARIIEFASTLNVHHIVFTALCCTIPKQMFSCTSFITLELKGCYFSPNDLRFPAVRTLRLEHCWILFRDKECSSGRVDFRQECPKLITLSLVECIFIDTVSLQKVVRMIMGPDLVNLTVVARECIRSNPHQMEILAPGLEDFTLLHNSAYARFPLVDFPALKHAVVDASKPNYPQEHQPEVCLSLCRFLQGLHNAEFISLSYSIIQPFIEIDVNSCCFCKKTLAMVPGILEDQPSPFRRLKSLTLKMISDLKHWQRQKKKKKKTAKVDKKHWQIPAEVVTYLLSGSPAGSADLLIES